MFERDIRGAEHPYETARWLTGCADTDTRAALHGDARHTTRWVLRKRRSTSFEYRRDENSYLMSNDQIDNNFDNDIDNINKQIIRLRMKTSGMWLSRQPLFFCLASQQECDCGNFGYRETCATSTPGPPQYPRRWQTISPHEAVCVVGGLGDISERCGSKTSTRHHGASCSQ